MEDVAHTGNLIYAGGKENPKSQNFPQKSSILYKLYFPLPQTKLEGSDEIFASSNSNNW